MRGKELTPDERDLLSRELGFDQSLRAIARMMARDPSVIVREVSRNGGREDYRAMSAQTRADEGVLAQSSAGSRLISACMTR